MPAQIITAQGLDSSPTPEGMVVGTNLIVPPLTMAERLAHFPDDIYDLSPESHLIRLVKVLLGDAGAGRLAKANVLARLQQSIYNTHFFDLDRFYGSLFGAQRLILEALTGDPLVDTHTEAEWAAMGIADDSYRSRMEQLARAIAYGATPAGMELAAEAILNCDVDVYESWLEADRTIHSYLDLQGIGTYAAIEGLGTYGDLQSDSTLPGGAINRYVFDIVPKRPITEEERYSLIRVLGKFKPATMYLRISEGAEILTEVPIREAAADSEYWRIEQSTVTGGTVVPKQRPPHSSYQGEAFSHLFALAGVSSYSLNIDGSVLSYRLLGAVHLLRSASPDLLPGMRNRDGLTIIFTPDLAIASMDQILAGRLVSDGILVRHPYTGAKRGNPIKVYSGYNPLTNTPYASAVNFPQKVFSDGYELFDPAEWTYWGSFRTRQHFWCTPERSVNDRAREVVEMKLRSDRLVNHISFDVARFPHQVTVEAWDEDIGEWVGMWHWEVSESYPERISRRVVSYSDTHPQHSLAGHWLKLSATIEPIRTSKLRILLQRHNFGTPPLDAKGQEVPYSLAVRNWDVGYRIGSRADIPEPDEDLGGGFATSIDAKGNTTVLDVFENKASALIDGDDATAWRSEPQPTNRAVVNLYLDVRTPEGDAQVIDQFFLDPAKSGPHLNIYWCDQEDYASFPASDNDLPVQIVGNVHVTHPSGLTYSNSPDPAYVKVLNADLHFDPMAVDWWMGFHIRPDTDPTVDTARVLIDAGTFKLVTHYDPVNEVEVVTFTGYDTTGAVISTVEVPLQMAVRSTNIISLAYDKADNTIILESATQGEFHRGTIVVDGVIPKPSQFFIGGSPTTPGSAMLLINAFIKLGVSPDPVDSMRTKFASYVLTASPGNRLPDFTANSILRFDHRFVVSGKWGFRGGTPNLYPTLTWHPIPREYRLTKGFLKIPATKAKFFCFEFVNLVPGPVESFVPISRHVRLYPSGVSRSVAAMPLKPPGNQWPGLQGGLTAATRAVAFTDTVLHITQPKTNKPPPTAAHYATDPQHAVTLRNTSWLFGFQEWQIGHKAPRFDDVGPHVYDEFDTSDRSLIGYFVALKAIRAYRFDHERDDDTPVYRDSFHDLANVATCDWDLNPNYIYGQLFDVATSKPMVSRHPVRAVQFAATQSDAEQIIPDDGFQRPDLASTLWDDDAAWHTYGDARLTYSPEDNMVIVERAASVQPDALSDPEPAALQRTLVDSLPHPVFSYRDAAVPLVVDPNTVVVEGGIESGLQPVSPRGMLHAGARVTGITDSIEPLVLQLIGSDDTVLAEEEQFVRKGETVEWFLRYHLGATAAVGFQLYNRRSIVDEPVQPIIDDGSPSSTGQVPVFTADAAVRVRIIQRNASADSWKVDRLSVFDDSILWEFSVDGGATFYEALDIRSDPNGVLTFPDPGPALVWKVTAYRPGRIVSSLQIRPWYRGQMGTMLAVPDRGPNVSSFDHEPPIDNDPEFNLGRLPVPGTWADAQSGIAILTSGGEAVIGDNSTVYARTTEETVPEPVEQFTGDGHIEVISGALGSETMAVTVDAAARLATYKRTTTETLTAPADTGSSTNLSGGGGLVHPPDTSPTGE